jgi:hypothetical protein
MTKDIFWTEIDMSNAREQILQTTCALLEKQGYHGTGLETKLPNGFARD